MAVHAELDHALKTGAAPGRVPSLPLRLLKVFYAPGHLFEALRARPLWGSAMLLGAVAVAASFYLIPAEVWEESFREQMLRSGRSMPAGFEFSGPARIFATVGGALSWGVMAFFLAGVLTVIFHFLLGDEARYTQYLSVVSHAQLISALAALLLVPLKLAQGDPQLTLNLGLFVPVDGSWYLFRVLRTLDLFMIWSFVVMALGVSKLDRRRSWASAASFLFAVLGCLVLVIALFTPPA